MSYNLKAIKRGCSIEQEGAYVTQQIFHSLLLRNPHFYKE